MKSRITIEVDFENSNTPIIQIYYKQSDDIRDNLIHSFLQSFCGSSWCNVRWQTHHIDHEFPENNFQRVYITPIKSGELAQQAKVMAEQAALEKKYLKK